MAAEQNNSGTESGTRGSARTPGNSARPGTPRPVTPIKKKKSKKPFIILGLVLLALIAIAAFVYALIQIENFPPRDTILNAAYKLDPRYESFEARVAEVEERESNVATREAAVKAKEDSVAEAEARTRKLAEDNAAEAEERFRQREEELDKRERSLTPIWRLPLSERDLLDMQSLAKTYAQMDPEQAAEILAELDGAGDIAAILYHMAERSAASILAAMSTELAAEITDILLYK